MAGKQEANRAKAMRARAGLTLAAVAALTPGVAGYIPMALKPGPFSTSCGRVLSARPSCDFGGPSVVATSWPLMRGAAISALRASSAEEQPSAEKTQRNTDEEKIVQDFKIEGTGEGGRVTEEDVEKLVVDAEDLWEKALDARQQAEDLCTQAEDAATMSEEISTAAAQSIDESSPFSLKLVAKVSASLHALAVRAAGCRALIEIILTGAMWGWTGQTGYGGVDEGCRLAGAGCLHGAEGGPSGTGGRSSAPEVGARNRAASP